MLVLFVAAGAIVYLVWDNYFNDKKDDKQNEQRVEQVEEKEKKMSETEQEKDEAEKAVEEKKVAQYDGEDPNEAGELSGVVTYAGVSGGVLMVRVNIDQYLDSGKCELNLVRDDSVVYSDMAEIVNSASTATCAGFDVPVGGLGGNYQVKVLLSSGEKTGVIEGEATV